MRNKQKPSAICLILLLVIILATFSSPVTVRGQEENYTSYLPLILNKKSTDPALIVAEMSFSNKFSPFYANTKADNDVISMTQLNILTTDRRGGVVNDAILGETRDYLGTPYLYQGPADVSVLYDQVLDQTTYRITLRQDLQFSDGAPVSADDIIFTYYTLLDPTYNGSSWVNQFDIVGLRDYQTQTTEDVYQKYADLFDAIYAAGHLHVWDVGDSWTQEQQDDVWARLHTGSLAEVVKIVDYVCTYYLSYAEEVTGFTPEQISANEGLRVMFGMVLWGFGSVDTTGDHSLTTYSGRKFDLITEFPTNQDYLDEIMIKYDWDIGQAFSIESVDGTDVLGKSKQAFILYWGPLDEGMGGQGIPNITGIVKIDAYSVNIIVNGFSAPAVYTILGENIAPLHYYGDLADYDYENNKFGFAFGDLSKQISLMDKPLGAGPYVFSRIENGSVYFTANDFYYRGTPKIREVQFKQMATAEIPAAIRDGSIDIGDTFGSRTLFEEISSYNSSGEITGDVITTSLIDNLGYGYIGLNADKIKVGTDIGSESSKNLRKGLDTILAVYRESAIENYYGKAAVVPEYPISRSSWAAPQPTDPGYRTAFSVDVTGNPIYSAGMTYEERIAAAEQAALGFFEAAGYTVENGKVTAAPEGAKLSYEVIVPGGGTGDHPVYALLTNAKSSLTNIGMNLNINDPVDVNYFWDALATGTQELWAAAWGASIDPDMYQVYHSNNIIGAGGTEANYFHIMDQTLDGLVLEALQSPDQSYRKTLYRSALDIVMDWGVELPTYQRQNATLMSSQRVIIDTVTPDISTFWGWMREIELMEIQK